MKIIVSQNKNPVDTDNLRMITSEQSKSIMSENRTDARKMRRAGMSLAAIARQLKISRQRVDQICTLGPKEVDTGACDVCRRIVPSIVIIQENGERKLVCNDCMERMSEPVKVVETKN